MPPSTGAPSRLSASAQADASPPLSAVDSFLQQHADWLALHPTLHGEMVRTRTLYAATEHPLDASRVDWAVAFALALTYALHNEGRRNGRSPTLDSIEIAAASLAQRVLDLRRA